VAEQERGVSGNYKKVIDDWEVRAKAWDYQEKYEKLGLEGYSQDVKLPIVFYGKKYWINRQDGSICEAFGEERKADFSTAIAIYSLFFHSLENPRYTGRWVPFREVKRAAPFQAAYQKTILNLFAETFNGKMDKLIAAGEKLGFKRIDNSDVGFEAEVFSCIPLRFLFWDGDDEFMAQTNILFDAEITDYIHEETVVMIASEGVKRLIEAIF